MLKGVFGFSSNAELCQCGSFVEPSKKFLKLSFGESFCFTRSRSLRRAFFLRFIFLCFLLFLCFRFELEDGDDVGAEDKYDDKRVEDGVEDEYEAEDNGGAEDNNGADDEARSEDEDESEEIANDMAFLRLNSPYIILNPRDDDLVLSKVTSFSPFQEE